MYEGGLEVERLVAAARRFPAAVSDTRLDGADDHLRPLARVPAMLTHDVNHRVAPVKGQKRIRETPLPKEGGGKSTGLKRAYLAIA